MNKCLRIGLLAEGKTELGDNFKITPQQGGKIIVREKEGALHTLIRRELGLIGFDCHFIHQHPSLSRKGLRKRRASPEIEIRSGHTILDQKYLQKIVIAWKPEEVDIIIILVDADENLPSRKQQLKSALKTIQEYHLDINEEPISDKSIGGLAIRNFETWLLSDKNNLEKILGVETPELDKLEELENSKSILDNAIVQSTYLIELKRNQRDYQIRWDLAKTIDLGLLTQKCPQGYGKFIELLKILIS